jgi:dihydrofolate reductase
MGDPPDTPRLVTTRRTLHPVAAMRLIAAIDTRRGLATATGIPWRLPGDVNQFRQRTVTGPVLMGRATYDEFAAPLGRGRNYVLTGSPDPLRPGFVPVGDLGTFLAGHSEPDDLWVIGGAGIFAQTITWADTLHLTRVEGDFDCTKFFPSFESHFELTERSPEHRENGISYRFETWESQLAVGSGDRRGDDTTEGNPGGQASRPTR